MKYELVIFDLDGTILNTLGDLAGAVNHALSAHGFPTHDVEDIRRFIGNGVSNLMRRALPAGTSDATHAEVLTEFKAYYREHMNDLTRPYDGIIDLLGALRAAGVKVGINSNKFDAALQNLCHIHFSGWYDMAMGECETTPRKPDPTAARRIMAALGAVPERSIYVGDSAVDIETARNAGMDAAWVGWGFRTRAEMADIDLPNAFDSVNALKDFLLS